jgi:YD repeat-containing protein
LRAERCCWRARYYDPASRITSETLNGGAATTYSYDETNELTNDAVATYSYDLNGNRTMPGYTTGPANELTNDGTWKYYFDANGNRVGKANTATGTGANLPAQLPFPLGTAGAAAYAAWSYGYDNRNRLVSAQETTSGGVQIQATYVYDALGTRI